MIPVVGFFVGFPLGVYLEELLRRQGGHEPAWRSTREALRAMGLSILIELSAAVLAAGAWLWRQCSILRVAKPPPVAAWRE